MTSLFRVTVVAEAHEPVAESRVEELLDAVCERVPGAVTGEDAASADVRGDRHGFSLVLLVEAESSDDAVNDVEEAARSVMAGGHETDDRLRLEQVRAEPAYNP